MVIIGRTMEGGVIGDNNIDETVVLSDNGVIP